MAHNRLSSSRNPSPRKTGPVSSQWRLIPEHEPYEASRDGRIRRVFGGTVHVLTPRPRKGTAQVCLSWGRAQVFRQVSRLVLLAWDRTPVNGEVAHHVNGDGLDDRLSNLRWESKRTVALKTSKMPDWYDANRYPCGHPRTPENTHGRVGGKRQCAICNRERAARYYRARKAVEARRGGE